MKKRASVKKRDNFALHNLLSLIGLDVPHMDIQLWNDKEYSRVKKWAGATYLKASDNNITIPKKPKFLEHYTIQARM